MPNTHENFHSPNGKRLILIVDDEAVNREMLGLTLESEYEVIFAEDGLRALELIREHRETLSLILLDLLMPILPGIEVLRENKSDPLLRPIPVIVMTADQNAEIECLGLGAIDFIPKPYPRAGVILARVLRTIELSEDRQIISSTERDPLTGLYNREYFYSYAEQFDQRHRDTAMDAVIVDVNHFRMINERYGKTYADGVLRRIGEKLRGTVSDSGGIVCRREADTFMVYCPHREDYREILENASVGLGGDESSANRVRLRMGVYAYADKTLDIERRFDRAKIASDTVRSHMTRTIAFYDNTLHEKELYAEQLIEEFQTAVREEQFLVFFQPKFDVRPDVPVLASAEALVRWQHPTLGMISPGVFIPLFEENGLIQELDNYVWRRVAEQLRDWKERFGLAIPVSVNVSRVDMYDAQLVETLQGLIEEHGLTTQEFLLEITESAYTQDSRQIIETVGRLRELGFRIEMDDFGTGYSSLNMISSLPIDALKLDMQFIRDAFRNGRDTRLIEIIIDIADYLSVPVIAEGVETEEQLNALKAMGCDIVQGYYFSKPIPAAEYEHFLLERKRQGEEPAPARARADAALREDKRRKTGAPLAERHKQEESRRQANIYQGMLEQYNALADNSLTVFRTNLTTGVIQEVRGYDLYDTDRAGGSITDSARVRAESFLSEGDRERYEEIFELDKLIDRYYKGLGPATFVGYCRRQSGRQCFVKFSGSAVIDPITEDVIAFGVETEHNTERVSEVLNEKVLAQQYDMVTYLVGENYGVVIGDAKAIRRSSIVPKKRDGLYRQYIEEQVLPGASPEVHTTEELRQALSLETIAASLEQAEPYVVDVTCDMDGETVNKRFSYYTVDRQARFYLLLKADITDVLREERERSELLVNALREAERANAAKTAFLSNMSHEIRTPMNAIIGLDSIALTEPKLLPQTREYLEKIGGSAKHLLSLINDILDMSRIESGRLTLRVEEFSFAGMLEQINTMVQAQCRDKGLSYDCRVLGHVEDFYIGDDMKLKQVLINILSNAIKFTEAPGSIVFTVEQTARFEDNSTLRFMVRDTGVGMDPAFLPRIFDPFSQKDSGRSSKDGSTGLGMASTKNIVERMNGTIAVTSEKGVGSEFTVCVTLRNGSGTSARHASLRPGDMRVLVVDDDPIACEHARLVLEEVGIAAETCLSGPEALKLIEVRHAKHEPYDPGQDGVELTREIRTHYNNETTIIILTAYNWDDIMDEAILAGVDSFMAKPLFASNVLEEFEKVVKRKDILPRASSAPVELAGRHILLAEDMMINAEIMKQILSMQEMLVDHAENGALAVERFEDSEPGYYDAILMDVRMPVMDGLEAASAIRALDRPDAKIVPIIALTANAFDEDVQRSLQMGMNAHLAKPVEMDHLYETLRALIRD